MICMRARACACARVLDQQPHRFGPYVPPKASLRGNFVEPSKWTQPSRLFDGVHRLYSRRPQSWLSPRCTVSFPVAGGGGGGGGGAELMMERQRPASPGHCQLGTAGGQWGTSSPAPAVAGLLLGEKAYCSVSGWHLESIKTNPGWFGFPIEDRLSASRQPGRRHGIPRA